MDLHNIDSNPLQFDYEINHLKELNTDQMKFNAKINSVLLSYPESLPHCDFSNELSQPIEKSRASLFENKIESAENEHFQEEKEADKIDNMAHF